MKNDTGHCFLFTVFLLFIGCEEKGVGTVSFGSNDDLLNCPHDTYVFIDGDEIGTIPGYCDSIIDCSSDYTLNQSLFAGDYSYRIEIRNESGGTCFMEKTGDFTIEENGCIKIYFNVVQNEN